MVETEGGGAKALFARLLLLVLNVALFGLGIALAVMGSNEEGTAGLVKSIYANHGVTFAAFQEPDYAMAVAGAFITLTSMQGIVGAMTGHKPTLFAYHTFCLFLLTGVIYAAEMTRIYRDEADATVAAYWSRLDPRDMSARDDNLVNYSEDRTKHIAKRWFTDANNILIAVAVFLSFALVASGSVMGLKYTLKRVGAGANFMGILFGFFLLVLCLVVARATYVVPDALSLDVSVDFPVDADGHAGEPVDTFVALLKHEPWKIFRDDEGAGSSRPHGVDPVASPPPPLPPPANETSPPAPPTRRLLEDGNATDAPPPAEPPASPPAEPPAFPSPPAARRSLGEKWRASWTAPSPGGTSSPCASTGVCSGGSCGTRRAASAGMTRVSDTRGARCYVYRVVKKNIIRVFRRRGRRRRTRRRSLSHRR